MKPGSPCQRIVQRPALSGSHGGLLLYFAFAHIAHFIRDQDAQVDCSLCRLPAWSFASLFASTRM